MPYQLSSPTPGVQSSGDGIVQGADGPREPPVGRPAGPSRDGCATVVGDRGQNVRVHLAITLVALIATVLAGTAVADRLKIPAPLFLIVVGAIGCYLPFVPQIHLEPEVVLVGLLPPLLYSAAIQTSLVDFAANRGSILLLSVGLVVATTFTVGAAVHWLLPDLGWPAALAIGAVVAPPDAVAATAIGRRIGLPRRLVTILEGESLFNDATALVSLRTAIAASAAATSVFGVGGDFLLAAGGGAVIGFLGFLLVAWMRRRVTDPLLDTALSFLTPFAVYVAAEEIHASGVISVVVAGLLLGHKAPIVQTAQSRITERITWRTVAYVLENTVFLLIGLQLDWILEAATRSSVGLGRIALTCGVTLVVVIVTRLVWVFPASFLLTRFGRGRSEPMPWTHTFLLGWAGMRGVVTLAAAFIIPVDTPHRDVLLLIAFTVVAGTLFIQGFSLPWLTRRLDVRPPDPAADALARATLLQQASHAGFKRLGELEYDDPQGVCDLIRSRIEQRTFAAWEQLGTVSDAEAPSELYARVRLEMINAERKRVLEVRSQGQVPSEIVSEVLGMLDIEESMLDAGSEARASIRSANAETLPGQECAELEAHPPIAPAGPDEGGRLRGVPRDRRHVGRAAALPRLRQRRLLRLLGWAARHEPLPRHRPHRHAVGRAGRDVAVVLRPSPERLSRRITVGRDGMRRDGSRRDGTDRGSSDRDVTGRDRGARPVCGRPRGLSGCRAAPTICG